MAGFGQPGDPAGEPFAAAARQLPPYFAGDRTAFDLPLAPAGHAFQRRVWAALQTIPYGQTCSYGELAEPIGSRRPAGRSAWPTAGTRSRSSSRVTGSSASDGSLTGYGGGLDRKRFLLGLEGGAAR